MSRDKGFFRRVKGSQPQADGPGRDILQLRIAQIRHRNAVHEIWWPENSAEPEQMKDTSEEAPSPQNVGKRT